MCCFNLILCFCLSFVPLLLGSLLHNVVLAQSLSFFNLPCRDGKPMSLYSPHSMGVRVMDTTWVARRGSSLVRKGPSTPPAIQPPAPPPLDTTATPQSPNPDLSVESPSPTPPSSGSQPGPERTR